MTWKEFKDYIDSEIELKRVPDEAEIEYIDISHPCFTHESCAPGVYFSDGTVAIH